MNNTGNGRVRDFFRLNGKLLLVNSLAVALLCLLATTYLLKIKFLGKFLQSSSLSLFVGMSLLHLLLLVLTWERGVILWNRYKNTKKVDGFPLTYIDYVFIYCLILSLVTYLKAGSHISFMFKNFVLLNFFFFCAWFFPSFFKKRLEETSICEGCCLNEDEPINKMEDDCLNRGKFVEDLSRQISSLTVPKSFTIGLYGSWGEGKTSIINLLIADLLEKNKEKFLVLRFEPWHFKDEEAIMTAFFNQIESTIAHEFIFPDFKRTVEKYRALISTGLSYSGFSLKFGSTHNTVESTAKRIESYLECLGRKLLVFIDDIDRLEPNEMMMVFKLVRKNSNFKNIINILSFDREVVTKAITHCKVESDFLDKIVQLPIKLPEVEQSSIDIFFRNQVEKLFEDIEIYEKDKEFFLTEFDIFYVHYFRKYFKTLRIVKRYVNAIHLSLPPVKDGVNLFDFFLLELIKQFYPKIYKDIWNNPWCYTELGQEYYYRSLYNSLESENINKFIKVHFERILDGYEEKSELWELLTKMFTVTSIALENFIRGGNGQSRRKQKRISEPACFPKYFLLQVPKTDIPDELVEGLIDKWNSEPSPVREKSIKKVIIEEKEDFRIKLLDKLIDLSGKLNSDVAVDIVEVLRLNLDLFSKERQEGLSRSEYQEVISKIVLIIENAVDQLRVKELFNQLIENSDDMYFIALIVLLLSRSRRISLGRDVVIQLNAQAAQRFQNYFIDENVDIFDTYGYGYWIMILFQWASNWMCYDGKNSKTVSDYVCNLMSNNKDRFILFVKKGSDEFFEDSDPPRFEKFFRAYDCESFVGIAKSFLESESLSDDERELVASFYEEAMRCINKARGKATDQNAILLPK